MQVSICCRMYWGRFQQKTLLRYRMPSCRLFCRCWARRAAKLAASKRMLCWQCLRWLKVRYVQC